MRFENDSGTNGGGVGGGGGGGVSSNNNSSNPSSWMGWKEKGKVEFERGNYEASLDSYRTAITYDCPAAERQIMLSNMVACRLKIGGRAQAEAAVEAAKQCIQINPQWAKGHIRLASAYIALGEHSNDACNSLQRALQLDPTNPTARDMLVRELRRDSHGTTTSPSPSAPPQDQDDQTYEPQQRQQSSSSSSSTYNDQTPLNDPNQEHASYHDQDAPNNNNNNNTTTGIDDSITWRDQISFYYQRAKWWYLAQSDDVKTLLQVFVGLILLYIAFGGRFGLGSLFGGRNQPTTRGNYGAGNVYDQYYYEKNYQHHQRDRSSAASYPYRDAGMGGPSTPDHHQTTTTTSSTPPRTSNTYERQYEDQQYRRRQPSSSSNHRYNNYHNDDDYYYQTNNHRGGDGSSGFHFPNLFDGSIQSMLILAAIGYLCHRNGINPMQVIFMLNMMNRGARHGGGGGMRRGGFGGMGGMYGGMGGMGRGFGRRRW